MSGVRVYNKKLLELGLTLPGFVDRSKVIASLPSLGLLTLAAHTPDNWEICYKELDNYTEVEILAIIEEQPDIIAFSSLTARINETYALAARFRKHGIKVAIGGYTRWLMEKPFIPETKHCAQTQLKAMKGIQINPMPNVQVPHPANSV